MRFFAAARPTDQLVRGDIHIIFREQRSCPPIERYFTSIVTVSYNWPSESIIWLIKWRARDYRYYAGQFERVGAPLSPRRYHVGCRVRDNASLLRRVRVYALASSCTDNKIDLATRCTLL